MCPVPIHGSLAIITSPGFSVCAGNFFRKCLTVAGKVPMNEGIESTDCAIEWPSASVNTTAKSFASRTSTENDVRTNAADASSTMLTRRFHWISSVTGSSFIFFIDALQSFRHSGQPLCGVIRNPEKDGKKLEDDVATEKSPGFRRAQE